MILSIEDNSNTNNTKNNNNIIKLDPLSICILILKTDFFLLSLYEFLYY